MLFAGGVVRGAFATGGPMAVYAATRAIPGKAAYRATLSVLWTALNLVLLATYASSAQIDQGSMSLSLALLPSCALGLVLGEVAHHRVPAALFRASVFVVLALAGCVLALRG